MFGRNQIKIDFRPQLLPVNQEESINGHMNLKGLKTFPINISINQKLIKSFKSMIGRSISLLSRTIYLQPTSFVENIILTKINNTEQKH